MTWELKAELSHHLDPRPRKSGAVARYGTCDSIATYYLQSFLILEVGPSASKNIHRVRVASNNTYFWFA